MNDHLQSRPLSKFKTRTIDWLFKPFIPYGFITTICGDGEVGKSTAIYDILARITVGEAMPAFGGEAADGSRKGSVVVLSKEDDPGLMIKPRLQAAGADVKKVHAIGTRNDGDFELIGRLDNTLAKVEELIGDLGDVRAILIDPITDFAGDLRLYHEDQVRKLLGPIARLAARHNIAVINVLHLSKNTRKKPRERILGSVGLVNISRSVLVVGRSFQTDRRFLMMEKANLWHEKKSAAFAIENIDGQPVVEWEADWENVDIDEVLNGKSAHVTKQQKAAFKLQTLLADGPMPVLAIQRVAEADGVHFNTFKTAKKAIGIESEKRDDGWWWRLPTPVNEPSEQEDNEPPRKRIRIVYSDQD